jgi:CDP-diglyceride synthetase
MLGRFGQMLCWGASVVALLCAAFAAYFAFDKGPDHYFEMMVFGLFGAAIWTLGRALNSALLRK